VTRVTGADGEPADRARAAERGTEGGLHGTLNEEVRMSSFHRAARRGAGAALIVAAAAITGCQSGGALGQVLGSVLGGGGQQAQGGQQVSATIAGVDARAQQIGIQQRNGQTVGVGYDGKTRVIYQNQSYPVTALERGDEVVLRILDAGNGAYYTDSVHVTRSVTPSGGGASAGGSGSVQSIQGVVRQIDRNNGLFSLDVQGGTITVSMPYGATRADVTRFQNLRSGDQVRLAGVFLNNTRVELRQFQ
jgi:hypothetical protein